MARDTEVQPSLAILANNLASALLLYEEIDEDARKELARLSASSSASLRLNSVRALLRHGKGEACRTAILARLKDESPGIREFAARAWLRFPGAELGPLEEAWEKETDPVRARRMADLARRLAHRWDE